MKKQVLLLFALLMAICGYAQPWKMGPSEAAPGSSSPMKVQKRSIELTGDQFWWGYFSSSKADKLPFEGCLGYKSATTIDAAIAIPANHEIVGNGTVKAIRFWLGDDISAINSDITVWISSSLPSSAAAADYSQTIEKSAVTTRLNEVELTTPFVVNNQKFYVGYSFSTSGKSYPVMSYGSEDVPNSFFFRVTNNSWMDFPAKGYGYGVLALDMLIDGIKLPDYKVNASDFETGYALIGGSVSVPVTIANEGKETVTSVSYTITTGSDTSAEKTISVSNLPSFGTTTISIPFPADKQAKKYAKTLTITKVNGQPNTSTTNVATGSIITILEKPVATPVVEEFTGTWCGYCPYGMVGMATAHEQFGDQVVLIAAHNGDPMEVKDYNPIMAKVSTFPSSFINRIDATYPSASNLSYYLRNRLQRVTVGSISVDAMWTSDEKNVISIDTQTKFVYNDENGQYGIAYVLIADGLTGTGSDWAQSNYLSGGSGDDTMSFWYSAASKVTGLEFDHVAVGAWDIENGVSGSVNSTIVSGEVQNYNFKADITSKSVVQDKSKLTVAALLIDQSTGAIVNAAQTTIKDFNPAAINSVSASDATTQTARYTLDGRKANALQHGVNIIRMSDGTVRKVMVK
jgi:hypothetical protein